MRQAARLAVGVTITLLTLWTFARPAPAQVINLTPFSNFDFNNPIGIDFHEPAGQLIMSVNYPTGLPNNLNLVAPGNAIPTQFSALAGLTNELKLASVRNTNCTGGFIPGTVFTGNGEPGEIVRISFDGAIIENPWVKLVDSITGFVEPALVRGSLFQDRVCAANGDLIVVTGNEQEPGSPGNNIGNVWRVTSTGVATLVVQLGKHLEGVTTVPNDPLHYGPLAGRIIAGDEDFVYNPGDPQPINGPNGKIFAVDPNTGAFFTIGAGVGSGTPCIAGTATPNGCHYQTSQAVHPEDLDLIRKNAQFFGIAFRDGAVLTAGAQDFSNRCGQILVTQEFPFPGTSGLYALRWNGSNGFIVDLLTANFNVQQWEHVTFTSGEDCFVPRLVLVKTPDNATFDIGDTLTFSIVIRNDGDLDALDVVLTDPLPTTGGLTWAVDSVTPAKPCSINGSQVLSCDIGTLAPGAAVTVVVKSTNPAGAPAAACTEAKLNNVATVTSSNGGRLQDTGDYTCRPPSISLVKTPDNATFKVGDQLTFTLVVTSNGPGTAQNVAISDPLPTIGGLTWAVTSVTPSGTCSINPGTQVLSCTFGNLAPQTQRTVVVTTNNAAGAPLAACTGAKINNTGTATATGLPAVTDTGDYICQPPGLRIVKTPDNATFNIGDPLTFTIVVTSTGPGTSQNVTLSDPLPTTGGLTWAVTSVTPSGTCSINAGTQVLSCTFGDLASQAQRTVVVTTNNAGGAPAAACTGQKLNNTATATATGVQPVQDTGDYTCQPPSITLVKRPNNGTFEIGDPVKFTLVVTSTGPGTAKNVTLTDPLPTIGGLTWAVTSVKPSGTCTIDASQLLSCSFGNLPVNARRTVVVTSNNAGGAPAAACTGEKIINFGTAQATGLDPVRDRGAYTCQPPSLRIVKTPDNATFNITDQINFTIVVTSGGPGTAKNVTLSDPLPTTGGLTWAVTSVMPAGTCSINASQQLSCSFGNLPPAAARTVVVTTNNAGGTPTAACTGQKLNNTATATAVGVSPVQDNGDYTCQPPSVRIVKTPDNGSFNLGDQVSFSIVVTSGGPGTAKNVTLSDPLPTTGGLTWAVTSVTPAGTCSINAIQQLSCSFGDLAPAATRTVVVTTNNAGGTPIAACTGQKLNNTATASSTGLSNVQDSGDTTCLPPSISIIKTPDNGSFEPGDQLSFTIVVKSDGPGTAANVTLSDPLPTLGGLTWGVDSVTPAGTCSVNASQTLNCTFGNLAAGATRTVVVKSTNSIGAPVDACVPPTKLNNLATAVTLGLPPVQDTGAYDCVCRPEKVKKTKENEHLPKCKGKGSWWDAPGTTKNG